MSTYDVLDRINEIVERHINKEFEQIYAGRQNTGLDDRVGIIYINEDAIAVDKHNDRILQYYGGFEYVDKEYRHEIGDYVFYTADDSRVKDHIDRFYGTDEAEEESESNGLATA